MLAGKAFWKGERLIVTMGERMDARANLLPLVVPLLLPGRGADGLEVLLEELAGRVVLALLMGD
jgi:hypothetical protein